MSCWRVNFRGRPNRAPLALDRDGDVAHVHVQTQLQQLAPCLIAIAACFDKVALVMKG